ncbi:MAG: FAD-dependent oxidoreductase [Fusobacteriaceae bacterium]
MIENEKILIVGGVAGGASTATRLRRINENAEIIIFEKGPYTSFANCGLPYYIGGTIENRENLIIQTPEKIKGRFEIDVRVNSEVIAVDPINKKIKVREENGSEYEESFDKLVLSPGAKALVPNLIGINSERILTLRNIPDTDKIKFFIEEKKVKNVVVIGGGYVGIEMAENLRELNLEVSLVEAAAHVLINFDSEISNLIQKEMASQGINFYLNKKAVKFEDKVDGIEITLESGEILKTDMVILSIGVVPDTQFLKATGLNLGDRGHILVNEHMETNIKGIYALGDAVLVKNYVTGEELPIPLAGPANRQGRIVANNIMGIKETYLGTLGTSIIKIFDLVAAGTGMNERDLIKKGIKFEKIYLHPATHATYYPGATLMTLKVLFNPETKEVLGAQAIGYEGIDKFIDVIATTMKFKGTVDDLAELELAYAPPYSSAKSPANMAGFIGKNIVENFVKQIYIENLGQYDSNKHFILDVRESIELIGGKLENSLNIPLNDVRNSLDKIPQEKEIWVYCAVGLRGYIAARILEQHGYKVRNLAGGLKLQNAYTTLKVNSKISSGCSFITTDVAQEVSEEAVILSSSTTTELNLTGLQCPGPLLQVKVAMDSMKNGDILKLKASDPGFFNDIQAWANSTGNEVLEISKNRGIIDATLRKGKKPNIDNNNSKKEENQITDTKDGMTIVVFSGDLDKAIASFIIANGAASMGKKVTMFFTFWGLSVIKKAQKIPTKKTFIEKMFGFMLPNSSLNLGLSKMNMGGMGKLMIRWIMKNKEIMSLEELISQAEKSGINLVACTMSMDVMGVHKEELRNSVNLGGVGYYLGEAETANKNLFI